MDRKKLIRKKITLKIIFLLSLITIIINLFIFARESFGGDYELKLKEDDIKNLDKIQQEMLVKFPKANIIDLKNAKKVRTHLPFKHWQCFVYYKNGDVAEEELRPAIIKDYIEENGKPAGLNNIFWCGFLFIVCVVVSYMKIKIQDQIDLIDEKGDYTN